MAVSTQFGARVQAFAVTLLFLTCLNSSAQEDAQNNWGTFRGPSGNGTSLTAHPPSEWSSTKNVAWKVELPGRGSSSPIVWGDKIFLTTAVSEGGAAEPAPRMNRREIFRKFDKNGDGQLSDDERNEAQDFMRKEKQKSLKPHNFMVMCLDRNSGKVLWDKTVAEKKPHDGHHPDHGYASASPTTNGEHVFFNFGSIGIFCFDMDGKEVWSRTDLGEMTTRGGFGEGSSLALFGDTLILPWDHEGQSRIEAIDKNNGKTIWKMNRDEPSSWSTPRIVKVGDKLHVVQSGENYTRGYDLKSGKEVWRSSGLSTRPVATPVIKGNVGYFASSRRGARLNAYRLDKSGDISNEPVWTIDEQAPDCASLLLSEDRLFYVGGNKGILSCANADDGSENFGPQRLPGINGIYSSPVAADGKVFVTGRGGKTVVIEDSEEYNVVGQNDVGEPVDATIAIAGEQLFIRGAKHLFCIAESKKN